MNRGMEDNIITSEELRVLGSLVGRIIREAVASEMARQLEASRKVIIDRMNEIASKQNPVYYTREEVCARLDICKATFHNWVAAGHIVPVRIGNRVYVEPAELDRVMTQIGSGMLKVTGRNRKQTK